jgi:hypothetical protein
MEDRVSQVRIAYTLEERRNAFESELPDTSRSQEQSMQRVVVFRVVNRLS